MIIAKHSPGRLAFTLVELLVAMAVFTILLMLVIQVVGETGATVHNTTAKAGQFQEAHNAFDSMARNLSQATLNTYYDYFNSDGKTRSEVEASGSSTAFAPASYGRQSELRFQSGAASTLLATTSSLNPGHAVFFQAPLGFSSDKTNAGLRNLLNTWGYYLEFRPDTDRPAFIAGSAHYRYRLMEFMQPTEEMNIYSSPAQWLSTASGGTRSHVIASNIIALVILPKLPSQGLAGDVTVDPDGNKLAPAYAYDSTTIGAAANADDQRKGVLDSKNQLPPVIEITMVALDEASASRMESGSAPPEFGLGTLFTDSELAQRTKDLTTLQTTLIGKHASFRIFTTEISVPGAKWSREQTN